MGRKLEPGEPVVLDDGDGERHLVTVPETDGTVEVPGLGVLSGGLFASSELGGSLKLGRRRVHVLPVTPELAFATLERGAQVIRPQDAARIAHACGIGPGTRVVEGGVGTGALTAYLAFLVGDGGRVHGVEVRDDHLETARGNLKRLGLSERVRWHGDDLASMSQACDAFVVDVPDPAEVVEAAARCLDPGGRAAFYSPLVSQVEAVRAALGEGPFLAVRTIEQLEREWAVHERGARPSFEMLGHTGFLTFATRISTDE